MCPVFGLDRRVYRHSGGETHDSRYTYIFLEYTKDLLIILIKVQELNIEGLQNSLRLDHRSLRFMFRYYTNYRQPKFGQLYNQIK